MDEIDTDAGAGTGAQYLRDLAERLLDSPTDHYKEAYEALIAEAGEDDTAAALATQLQELERLREMERQLWWPKTLLQRAEAAESQLASLRAELETAQQARAVAQQTLESVRRAWRVEATRGDEAHAALAEARRALDEATDT